MTRGDYLKFRFLKELSLLTSWGSGVCVFVMEELCLCNRSEPFHRCVMSTLGTVCGARG